MQISTAHPVNHIVLNNALYQPPIIQQNQQQPEVQRNSFILKWKAGTTVLKCCGCRKKIQNSPKFAPDDLVMAYKDIRQFADPVTGVLRYSDATQNVHFHLQSVCVRTRYPNFNYTWLDTTSNAAVYFTIAILEITIRVLLAPIKSI